MAADKPAGPAPIIAISFICILIFPLPLCIFGIGSREWPLIIWIEWVRLYLTTFNDHIVFDRSEASSNIRDIIYGTATFITMPNITVDSSWVPRFLMLT